MDQSDEIKIELDGFSGPEGLQFYSGQKMSGQVILTISSQAAELTEIMLHFFGQARVHLVKHSTKNPEKSRTEGYLDQNVVLFSKVTNLPQGTHVYRFELLLPHKLPSSYSGGNGTIEYYMEARAALSPPSNQLKYSTPFTIIGILDLNNQLEVSQRAELYDHKNICCCCCKSGPVEMLTQFSRRGFVAGEAIYFMSEITNLSRSKIKSSTARLIQRITYTDFAIETTVSNIIKEVHGGEIKPNSIEVWREKIVIPDQAPVSRLGGSRLIDLQYVIEFELNIKGCTRNLKCEIPILIGNIPLKRPTGDRSSVTSFFGASATSSFVSKDVQNL